MNYFEVLGLAPSFDIDLSELEKCYIAQQRLFHPDRYVGKPQTERTKAAGQSMLINDAYQALKSPLGRAKHLLAINGLKVGDDKEAVKPETAMLEEIMELRETAHNLASAAQAEEFGRMARQRLESTLDQLSRAFGQNDLPNAAQMTIRLGYLLKIIDEIRIQTKRLESH